MIKKVYFCEECEQECELVEIDEGGYEEIWGARMWHPMWTNVSDCCGAPYYTAEEWEDLRS